MSQEIERLLEGDDSVWNTFVDRYTPSIYRAVQLTVAPRLKPGSAELPDLIGDIVQEIFLRLVDRDYRLLRSYDSSRSAPVTWLSIVARSTALNHLRKIKPGREENLSEYDIDSIMAPPAEEPEKIELPEKLLSPRQETVLRLLFDQDMSVREAARTLGVEEQSIRSAKHRALTRLRAHYAPAG